MRSGKHPLPLARSCGAAPAILPELELGCRLDLWFARAMKLLCMFHVPASDLVSDNEHENGNYLIDSRGRSSKVIKGRCDHRRYEEAYESGRDHIRRVHSCVGACQ